MFIILNLSFQSLYCKFNTKQNPFIWKKFFAVLSNNWGKSTSTFPGAYFCTTLILGEKKIL